MILSLLLSIQCDSKNHMYKYCQVIKYRNDLGLHERKPGPEVIKLFSCSTQLRMKFILLINVKMPTIVGILTFISMINTTYESLKARTICILPHFSLYEQLKYRV